MTRRHAPSSRFPRLVAPRVRLRAEPDRGSVIVWLATAGFAMIVLVGLAVDLSGQVYAQQHARDVAAQAARAGGQQLQAPIAVRGQGAVTSPAASSFSRCTSAACRLMFRASATPWVRAGPRVFNSSRMSSAPSTDLEDFPYGAETWARSRRRWCR